MEWGQGLPALQKAAESGSEKARARLESCPELEVWLLPVWNAFQRLGGDRQMGMSLGPIPWTAIDRYAIRYRIDDFEDFEHMLSAMDAVYLEHARKDT